MNEATTTKRKPTVPIWAVWRWALHWQILLGLLIGAVLGVISGEWAIRQATAEAMPREATRFLQGRWDHLIYALFADLFLNGLRLIVVPLIVSALVLAIAGLGRRAGFARLGLKTVTYYLCTSTVAILIGLVLVNAIQPGVVDPANPVLDIEKTQIFADEMADLRARTEDRGLGAFLDTIREMVPPNFIAAAAQDRLLGLIMVSIIGGFFLARIAAPQREVFERFVQAVYDITLRITDLVLRIAPIGVAGLLARTLSENYAQLKVDARLAEFATIIGWFFITALSSLGIHFLVVLPLILLFLARVNPARHYRAMAPALMTAFSTASSAATLPVTLDCVEKRARVSNRTASFVLPLGATVNMDGTALYECVAAMFIAQAYGIELSFAQQFFIVIVALLTSIGVAGVPQASLVAIVIILNAVGVPIEGLAIILIVDRLLDMCRTAVNVFSDSCGAVVIAVSEGERDLLPADFDESEPVLNNEDAGGA